MKTPATSTEETSSGTGCRRSVPAAGDINPPAIARAVATLAARDGDDYLADATIRRTFVPLRAMFA